MYFYITIIHYHFSGTLSIFSVVFRVGVLLVTGLKKGDLLTRAWSFFYLFYRVDRAYAFQKNGKNVKIKRVNSFRSNVKYFGNFSIGPGNGLTKSSRYVISWANSDLCFLAKSKTPGFQWNCLWEFIFLFWGSNQIFIWSCPLTNNNSFDLNVLTWY